MSESGGPRAAEYAAQFEAAQQEFIRLVETLTDEQWRRVGRNYPQRFGDEDEGRSVGVIAHHVAISGPFIVDRIERMLDGRPMPQVDFRVSNAQHAEEHADVTRQEVLAALRKTEPEIATAVRAIPDSQLDESRDTPAGPMSVAMRLERVLVGHLKGHQGSIEAALA
jgi:DinB superfamily